MDSETKLSEMTLGEWKKEAKLLLRDIPPEHFLEAADKMFWKNTRQLGVELTGKDITKISDVNCIRKTFNASQDCRMQKEKIKDVFITDGIKKISNLLFTALALGMAALAIMK